MDHMLEQEGDLGSRYPSPGDAYPTASDQRSAPLPALDFDRLLRTLVDAVGEDVAQQFFWIAETGTVQTYEHRLTYRYVHIDRVTGRFCDQQRQPISAEKALAHALPAVQIEPAAPRMLLAPAILEPDLLPYVRLGAGVPETGMAAAARVAPTPARAESAVGRLFRLVRKKLSELGSAAPGTDLARDRRETLQENDLSLASFTRRPA